MPPATLLTCTQPARSSRLAAIMLRRTRAKGGAPEGARHPGAPYLSRTTATVLAVFPVRSRTK
jgi:hypothetical protein